MKQGAEAIQRALATGAQTERERDYISALAVFYHLRIRKLDAPANAANVKESMLIKGELTVREDLTIDGRMEGKIELESHNLSIGPQGKVSAEIQARSVIIAGDMKGNIFASEMVEIKCQDRWWEISNVHEF